jgi:hypothetical protein
MDFESRAGHSYSNTAITRLDRFIYQDPEGIKLTAAYLKNIKKLVTEESGKVKHVNKNFASAVIPSTSQIPRIDEQWTVDGKILYTLQYRCAAEAANLGRRRFREDNEPDYW